MTIPNAPPVEAHGMNIDDLFDEARNWLDGSGITSEADAEGVAKLLGLIREARKSADEQRKAEKAPHDAAAKAVQDAWNPLLSKCDLAADACKKALTPWQIAKEAEQREAADKARREAQERTAAAAEALRAAKGDDLAARAEAERLIEEAGKASKAADKLDRAKPQVAGGPRAVGLRRAWQTEVTDFTAFSRWAWAHRREEYEGFLSDLAEREGRRGPVQIPGINITPKRKVA